MLWHCPQCRVPTAPLRALARHLATVTTSAPRKQLKPKKLAALAMAKTDDDPHDPALHFRHGWRVATAAVLERVPIITPEPADIEQRWEDRSFELRNQSARPIPSEVLAMEVPGGGDIMGKMKEEPVFTPAPRVTAADEANDRRSLDRQLAARLYFIVKRTAGSRWWQFPQRVSPPEEVDVTLRQSAQKALQVVLGTDPWIHFLGNAPCAHLEHVYPAEYQKANEVYGAKIFFYRSNLIRGDLGAENVRQAADFLWVTKAEIQEYFSPEYYKAVERMLLPV